MGHLATQVCNHEENRDGPVLKRHKINAIFCKRHARSYICVDIVSPYKLSLIMMYNKLHFANALLPTGRKLSFHKKTYSELHPRKEDAHTDSKKNNAE